jgi:hypothetical protein
MGMAISFLGLWEMAGDWREVGMMKVAVSIKVWHVADVTQCSLRFLNDLPMSCRS